MDEDKAPKVGTPGFQGSLGEIGPEAFATALTAQEFRFVYQPQVDASGGRLVGFEALARWTSERFGVVPPDVFIPIMEQALQTGDFWHYLLRQVAVDYPQLARNASSSLHVALNLSADQLQVPTLAEHFIAWARANAIDASQLHIELTESALIKLSPEVIENLQALRAAGVAIWLDDFGTGFSSLRHLRDLPLSGLKIDKSFVSNLEENLDDFRIVSAIIAMANSLGLMTVAEGVETSAQAQMLTQLGCTILQGYLIGRPASVSEVASHWNG